MLPRAFFVSKGTAWVSWTKKRVEPSASTSNPGSKASGEFLRAAVRGARGRPGFALGVDQPYPVAGMTGLDGVALAASVGAAAVPAGGAGAAVEAVGAVGAWAIAPAGTSAVNDARIHA